MTQATAEHGKVILSPSTAAALARMGVKDDDVAIPVKVAAA